MAQERTATERGGLFGRRREQEPEPQANPAFGHLWIVSPLAGSRWPACSQRTRRSRTACDVSGRSPSAERPTQGPSDSLAQDPDTRTAPSHQRRGGSGFEAENPLTPGWIPRVSGGLGA